MEDTRWKRREEKIHVCHSKCKQVYCALRQLQCMWREYRFTYTPAIRYITAGIAPQMIYIISMIALTHKVISMAHVSSTHTQGSLGGRG